MRDMHVTAAADAAKQLVRALHVDEPTLRLAQTKCEKAGVPFSAHWARAEWRNEVLANRHDEAALAKAMETPAVSYLQYLSKLIAAPMEPAPRVVRALMDRYGFEFVAMMHKTRWPRELAWADRYRAHQDDIIAILAHSFGQIILPEQMELPKAQRNTSRRGVNHIFSRLVEYAHNTAFSITDLDEDPYLKLSPAEISEISLPGDDWYPLAIGYMHANLGEKLAGKNPQAIAAQAEKIREQYRTERRDAAAEAIVSELAARPLTRQVMPQTIALSLNLNATQMTTLHDRFISDIRAGRVITDLASCEREFVMAMTNAQATPPPSSPSPARAAEVKQGLRMIGKAWFNRLDPSLRENYEADRGDLFNQWRDAIETGRRPTPSDPVVDYSLFLIERKRNG